MYISRATVGQSHYALSNARFIHQIFNDADETLPRMRNKVDVSNESVRTLQLLNPLYKDAV